MKTIILVNPSGYDGRVAPPLGLGLIASFLENSGKYKAKIIDLSIVSENEMMHYIAMHYEEILLIGISTVSITFSDVIDLSLKVKYSFPKAVIVLGGSYPSFVYDYILSNYKCIDYITVGEGEQSTLDLALAIENNTAMNRVNGVAWRDYTGKPVLNTIEDAKKAYYNKIPIDYSLYNNKMYKNKNKGINKGYIITTRGCPFNCSFCANYNYSKSYCSGFRLRSLEVIQKELDSIINQYGAIDYLVIQDNDFLIDIEHSKRVLEVIINRCKDLREIKICTRVDSLIRSKEHLLKYLDFLNIEIGFESFSNSQLKRFNKKIYEKDIIGCIDYFKKNNYSKYSIDMLLFEPFVSIEEIKHNLKRIKEYNLCEKCEYALFLRCYLYPGTQITEQSIKCGLSTGNLYCDNWCFYHDSVEKVWVYLQIYFSSLYFEVKKLKRLLDSILANNKNFLHTGRILLIRKTITEISFNYAEELTDASSDYESRSILTNYSNKINSLKELLLTFI